MKVPSSSRSRSGLAWASCSSSIRAGSILGLTVIVVSFFESVFADHSKDHPVAVAYFDDTLTGEPYTTLLDSTRRTLTGCDRIQHSSGSSEVTLNDCDGRHARRRAPRPTLTRRAAGPSAAPRPLVTRSGASPGHSRSR